MQIGAQAAPSKFSLACAAARAFFRPDEMSVKKLQTLADEMADFYAPNVGMDLQLRRDISQSDLKKMRLAMWLGRRAQTRLANHLMRKGEYQKAAEAWEKAGEMMLAPGRAEKEQFCDGMRLVCASRSRGLERKGKTAAILMFEATLAFIRAECSKEAFKFGKEAAKLLSENDFPKEGITLSAKSHGYQLCFSLAETAQYNLFAPKTAKKFFELAKGFAQNEEEIKKCDDAMAYLKKYPYSD